MCLVFFFLDKDNLLSLEEFKAFLKVVDSKITTLPATAACAGQGGDSNKKKRVYIVQGIIWEFPCHSWERALKMKLSHFRTSFWGKCRMLEEIMQWVILWVNGK